MTDSRGVDGIEDDSRRDHRRRVPVNRVRVNGVSLHLVDEGRGNPLVFLHGFPLSHAMWDGQRRAFRRTQRVLIPDLRGFGRSVSSDDVVSMDQFADDIAALLTAVGVTQPITLCGLSMGGYIALAFARRHSTRLGRLVLCDTRAVPDSPEAAEQRRSLAARVLVDGPRVVVDAMLPKLFGPDTNEQKPIIVDSVRDVMLASSSRGIAAAQRGMADRIDSRPHLEQIRCPTLVIVGEHDAISPADEMRALAAAIPRAEFAVIEQVGHMAPLEAPQKFNTVLSNWLARH